MFAKLLKYDFKRNIKFFLIMYALIIGFAAVGRICAEVEGTTFVFVLGEICSGALWAVMANMLINNILRIWADFRRGVYGDESYLNHTLPVKTSLLFLSKFTVAVIILILNIGFSALALLINRGGTEIVEILHNFLSDFSVMLGFSESGIIWAFVGIIFIEMLTMIAVGFLAYILGYRKNNNKRSWSAAYIALFYLAVQAFIVVLLVVAGLFNNEIFEIFISNNASLTLVAPTIIICLVGYFVAVPVLMLLSMKALNRGVDVE